MLTIRANDFSEKQLAEIALAIQNRWDVPAFVKMHEIVVVDEDIENERARDNIIKHFDDGFSTILANLELSRAFSLEKSSNAKYSLKKIDGAILPKWMDSIQQVQRVPEGMHECPHCVPPNTLILGDNKQIIEYKIGDSAIGLKGLSNVLRTFSRPYKGEILTIKGSGMLPLTTTSEHPVLSCVGHPTHRRVGKKHWNEILFSDGRWFAAETLVPKNSHNDGNYLVVPIVKGIGEEKFVTLIPFIEKDKPVNGDYSKDIQLNAEVAWLLGLYVAGGSISKGVRFSLKRREQIIREKILRIVQNLGYSAHTVCSNLTNSMLVVVPSRVLARAIDTWCGHRASNKKIPDFILLHKDDSLVRAFLDGYEVGEGYAPKNKERRNKRYRVCSTTSKLLAQQLQLAYARLHTWACISIKNGRPRDVFIGRKSSLHQAYNISYPIKPNPKRSQVKLLDDRILSPIQSITRKSYMGNVCNLETTDNTYLVSNAVVHNCGKWFRTDVELSMHTKLHYLV